MKLFDLEADYVRMLIKDTIETYSGQWRIIHEAIQNSHDSIQLRDDIDQGKITIDLYIGKNKIIVTDNGKGIPIEEFPTIFTLGGTAKGNPELRKILKGSQGVGIKSTVFTSKFFEVETKYAEGKWSKRVEGCYKFQDPSFDDYVEEPKLQKSDSSNIGTKVSYSLNDYSVKDFFQEIIYEYCIELGIDEIKSEEELLDLIELYFRTQTYLGCVQSLLDFSHDLKPILVVVNVRLDYPTLEAHRRNTTSQCNFISKDEYHGCVLKREFTAIYSDFQEIHGSLKKSERVDRLFGHFAEVIENPPDPILKKVLIQKITAEQAKLLLSRIRLDPNTRKAQLIDDRERLEKHRRLLDKLNGIYLVIGPRPYLAKFLRLSPKQFLSINGLPTNIGLNPPRGAGELGYLLNIHFIMDLDTTLGYGKRNIPSVVKGQADTFFADIFGLLRRLARAIVGEREAIEPRPQVWDKEKEYEAYREPDNLFRNVNLPFKLPPKEEQDVICLFHEILGSGKLKGYFPFCTSINRTYDALMYVSNRPDLEMPAEISWRDLKIVEFKIKLSEIIEDFLTEVKFLQDIDLVVVWEDDYEGEREYVVSSLERNGIEPLPSAQKRIRLGTQSCQVIILKELLFPSGEL